MLSPAFLVITSTVGHELPPFRRGDKWMIPVGLDGVDFKTHDLHGLDRTRVLFHQPDPWRTYLECNREKRTRREFARRLEQAIETCLAARFGEVLGRPVEHLGGDVIGPDARAAALAFKAGEVMLLENLRFDARE